MATHFIIGIAGGTGAGKTTLANTLIQHIGAQNANLICHDSYYKDLSHLPQSERDRTNYDHPDAFDNDLLSEHLRLLQNGYAINMPVYDYTEHLRKPETIRIESRPITILEGILVLAEPELRRWMNIKIFVDAGADIRLIRRLQRDRTARGRTTDSVIEQYLNTVRPMHNTYVQPSRNFADLVVRGDGDLTSVIHLLMSASHNILQGQPD